MIINLHSEDERQSVIGVHPTQNKEQLAKISGGRKELLISRSG